MLRRHPVACLRCLVRRCFALSCLALLAGCGTSSAPSNVATKSADSSKSAVDSVMRASALPEGAPAHEGAGPGAGGDKYDYLAENEFQSVTQEPLSTFSIDVDTASYSKARMLLMLNTLPPPDAVRIEEFLNYFDYSYPPPQGEHPFAADVEVAECPWKPEHRLVRIGIKGRAMEKHQRPASNLVFLIDVSGSMGAPNRLPLLLRGMKLLVEQLTTQDRVAIVVYAGAAGLVLDSTAGDEKLLIMNALNNLQAGGSTNGGEGIRLAYQVALDHFIAGGVNRVILCSDGDFNVGTTSTGDLVRLVVENARQNVFLTVLGFGAGNHNDAMLEQISNQGNGNYAFVDTDLEARKVLVEQVASTLVTIAKDVKIQVEFNPAMVSSYRLIGYENRLLAAQDFNDDQKDAGEIGAGHTVTALYEIVPSGAVSDVAVPTVDALKYQTPPQAADGATTSELLTLKLRYKQPEGDTSQLLTQAATDSGHRIGAASQDFQFAAAVASFGMLLRNSKFKGSASYDGVLEMAQSSVQSDAHGYRREFLGLVQRAKDIAGR